MHGTRGLQALVVAVAVARGGVASAQPDSQPELDPIERKIRADVKQASEEAERLFVQATDARAGGELEKALDLFRRASRLAPALDHPHRRACGVLQQLERGAEAVESCEAALERGPTSPLNQTALAQALAVRGGSVDLGRALDLARRGAEPPTSDAGALFVWCQLTLMAQRTDEAKQCSDRLSAALPDSVDAHAVEAVLAALQGSADRAERSLFEARKLGMPEAQASIYERWIDDILARAESRRPGASGWAAPLLTALAVAAGVWLAGLVVLLAAGWILSRLTLRAADRMASSGEGHGDGSQEERRLRRVYKAVVLLCGLYFYLSVPILLVLAVGTGGLFIWLFFAVGYIPIKGILVVGLLVVITVGAILRGLFVRTGPVDLGHRLDLDQHPRFRQLLDEVARAIDTRPVDAAYLTPQTDMAVLERGGLWRSLRGGRAERCLLIGAGLLGDMKQIELRSVLAHEYGHFRNQDTAGGGFALAVRRSLIVIIVRLAQSGGAAWYNPVWLFLRAYHHIYLIVSQGASRLQEVLADRWAIRAYGSEAFIRGYTHVVERSVRFECHIQRTLREVIEGSHPLPNLYRYQPAATASEAAPPDAAASEDDLVRVAMEREPTHHDSHPSPRQRLAWARAMAVERQPEPDDDRPVWDLFEDPEALEKQMTATVRDNVAANHGTEIAG